MSSQVLEVIVRGKNETKVTFDQLSDSAKAVQSVLQGVGLAIGQQLTQLAAQIPATFREALEAQAKSVEAINSLNLALANQAHYTAETSKSLVDYASALQDVTTFDDEAIVGAEALLASFGMNEEQIKRTTAVALDFAAATGRDLNTAVNLLGKAFLGHTETMARYGITVDKNASSSEKFAQVLDQLNSRFAGQAAAQAQSFTGQMKQLGNAWDDAKEALGKFLGELLGGDKPFSSAIGWAKSLAKFLGVDLILAVSEVRAKILELFANLAEAPKVTQALFKIGARLADPLNLTGLNDLVKDLTSNAPKLAASLREQAAAVRADGDAMAAANGRALEFKNAEHVVRLGVEDTTASVSNSTKIKKLLYDSNLRALREIDRQIEQEYKANVVIIKQTLDDWVDDEKETADAIKAARDRLKEDGEAFMRSWNEHNKKLADETVGAALEIVRGLSSIGQMIGGVFGQLFGQVGDLIQKAIRDFRDGTASHFEQSLLGILKNPKVQAALAGIAAAVQAAFQGYAMGKATGSPGKGALAGAASGALTGAMVGSIIPVIGTAAGAVIGGGIGLVAGFLGGKKAQSEARAAMEQMRTQLLQQYGSLEALRKSASLLGVDISRAFSTKDPKVFQATVDQLNQALADQQRRLQGIQTAMQGLDLMTKGLTATIEAHGEATAADAAAFQRLGTYAAATFAAIVKEGGDVIGALQQLEPTLSQLAGLEQDFGIQGSSALQQLLGLRQIVVDNADIAQSIQGLNLLMKGLGDAGIQTTAIFQEFGQDAVNNFNELVARGTDANQALILMQPSLQQLWEHQQKFHDITDEATLALINQAEQAGIVGEDQKSIYMQILDVLKDIRDTIAGIPSDKYTTIHEDHHVTHSGDDGDNGNDGLTPAAGGYHGWVTAPRHFLAGEAGPEYVSVTPAGQMGRGGRGGPGSDGGVTIGAIHVSLPNVTNAHEFAEQLKEVFRGNIRGARSVLQNT
jgi:hypothetical protein